MNKKLNIKNIFGEKLDLLLEGDDESPHLIVFVHGWGTDKDEGFASFLEFADYLKNDFFIIRFDLSGYGASEGEDFEFQFQKAAGDADSVIRYAREHYPEKDISIIAHSLGTFVVSLLSPSNVHKTVFTSIPNSNPKFISEQLVGRIIAKGGKVDKEGISIYPRTAGGVQKIGKNFWRTLESFKPAKFIEELGAKTDLIIFKPMQDEVLENKYFEEYKELKNARYIEVDGDHNFKKREDRANLFNQVKAFLLD